MKKIKRIGLGTLALVATVGVPTVVAVSCGEPAGSSKESLGDLGNMQFIPKQIGTNKYYLFIVVAHTKGIGVDKVEITKPEYESWLSKGKK